jgi:hypothetical protein
MRVCISENILKAYNNYCSIKTRMTSKAMELILPLGSKKGHEDSVPDGGNTSSVCVTAFSW